MKKEQFGVKSETRRSDHAIRLEAWSIWNEVSANSRFEVGLAKDYPGRDFDLVTCFDCLHGDPGLAAVHISNSVKPDGTWMIVEPMAGDSLEQNLNQPDGPLVLRTVYHDLRADLAFAVAWVFVQDADCPAGELQ